MHGQLRDMDWAMNIYVFTRISLIRNWSPNMELYV
jgi:hypothetical protein